MPTAPPPFRNVRLSDLSDIVADCEALAAGECTMLGNWSLPQTIRHLAQGIDCTYDGFGFQANWFLRTFLGRVMLWRVLISGMPRGIRLPATATRLLPMSDPDLPAALEHLRQSVRRLENEAPTQPHPMFGSLSHDEARRLMLRHAEHHLSYAVPVIRDVRSSIGPAGG